METRTEKQILIWKLILNPMPANTEKGNLVAIAEDKELLKQWMKDQLAPEPYKDDKWYKVFKKGGPLEWDNPPQYVQEGKEVNDYGHGISSEWTTIEFVKNYIHSARNSFGFMTVPEIVGFKNYETLLLA